MKKTVNLALRQFSWFRSAFNSIDEFYTSDTIPSKDVDD